MLGKLSSMSHDKVLSRDTKVLGRHKIHSLNNVKGEKGVNTVSHVVGRVACRLPDSDLFGPEDLRKDFTPLEFVALTSLHDGLANVEVFRLDNAVCLRVVARDMNMVDSVSQSKNFESCNIGCSVISNNLFKTSPPAQDVLKDEVSDDLPRIRSSTATFGVGGKSIVSMVNIAIRAQLGHEESVDVSLPEEGGDGRDSGGNVEVLRLLNLAFMAGPGVPMDILIQVRPPELKEVASRCKDTLVAEIVVGILDETKLSRW